MTVFDPYGRNQPAVPGLNTGSTTQVSTLGPVPTGGHQPNRYRSGALSALAPFVGYLTLILTAAMGMAAAGARLLCLEGRLDATACTVEPVQLALAPLAVLVLGLVLAAIGGSLAKRRRAMPSLIVLVGALLALAGLLSWFSASVLGLPFP